MNRFPPDIEYCLDGATELLRLTADVSACARMMDYDTVTGLIDNVPIDVDAYRFEDALLSRSLEWRQRAAPAERHIASLALLFDSNHQVAEAEHVLLSNLGMLHARDQNRPTSLNRLHAPTWLGDLHSCNPGLWKNAESLLDPACVAASLPPSLMRWRDLMTTALVQARQDLTDFSVDGLVALVERQKRDAHERHHRDAVARGGRPLKVARPALSKGDRRRGRRVLRRSYELSSAVLGSEVKAFVAGQTITLEGRLFDYRVSKTKRLVEQASSPHHHSIPYRLDMHDKEGRFLATGCVVFADSPILDQVLALSLHVRDRESELELLGVTNWSRQTELFEENPVLRDLCRNERQAEMSYLPVESDEPPFAAELADRLRPRVGAALRSALGMAEGVWQVLRHPPVSLHDILSEPRRAMDSISGLMRLSEGPGPRAL